MKYAFPSRFRMPLVLAAALGACDLTPPWASRPGPAFPIDIAPSAVWLTARVGEPAPSQVVRVSGIPGDVGVSATIPPPFGLSASYQPDGSLLIQVTPEAPYFLAVGTYHGVLQIGTRWLGYPGGDTGWGTWEVPVTYEVKEAALTVSPDTAAFDYVLGSAHAEVVLRLDGPPDAGPWSMSVPPWVLAADPASGSLTPVNVRLWAANGYPVSDLIVITRGLRTWSMLASLTPRLPWISAPSTPVGLQAVQGQDPGAVTGALAVATEQDAVAVLACAATYASPGVEWLQAPIYPQVPGEVPIVLSRSDLPPGAYAATFSCRDPRGSSTISIPVALSVAPPIVALSPASLALRIDPSTPAGSVQAPFSIQAPGAAVTWTVSTDVPWLAASPSAGTTAAGGSTPVVLSVPAAGLAGLRSGSQRGGVTVTYPRPDGTPITSSVAVDLALDAASLRAAGPPQDVVGSTREVVLLGDGLTAATSVLFGTAPAAAFRVLDPHQIRATPPPLAAGTYPVSIPNAYGADLGHPLYRMAEAISPAAGSIASVGRKTRLVFDEQRGFLWVVNRSAASIERYRTSDRWARQALSIAGLTDATFSADGSQLIALAGADVFLVDADGLTRPASPAITLPLAEAGLDHRLSTALDGFSQIFPAVYGIRDTCYLFQPPDRLTQCYPLMEYENVAGQARSGARVLFGGDYGINQVWEAATSSVLAPFLGFSGPTSIALDRHGDLSLLVRAMGSFGQSMVFDASFARRPGALPGDIATAVVTQDGSRAVALDGATGRIRVFDLTAAPDYATGLLPELGTAGGVAPAADPGAHVVLALSADDRTLFVGGDQCIAVVPLP